jgi:hypothetical protein
LAVSYEIVTHDRTGRERVHPYTGEDALAAGSVVLIGGRYWLVDRIEQARVRTQPARYRLTLRHPGGRRMATSTFPRNLEFPSAGSDPAYRLGHDRTHTTLAHHPDPSHRVDALRRPAAAGGWTLARDGDAGSQRLDHGARLTGALEASQPRRVDRSRVAADRARSGVASP